jgi:glycosyltransferase involved in cell wall biosynthesis
MGGLPEGIAHNESGVVVNDVTQPALTAALDHLLEDPNRLKAMSLHAARHAAHNFRWESVVEKITALCEDTIDAGRASRPGTPLLTSTGSDPITVSPL